MTAAHTTPAEGAPPVRQKSGLVRSASGFDAFVFALAAISVGIAFEWGNFFGSGFYPGANLVLALAISLVASAVIAWAYQYWGQVFPRSGGDYVFLSRGLHPGVALGVNFVYCWVLMVSPAFAMSIMQPLCSAFASALAEMTGWGFLDSLSTWFNTNLGYAVIGTTQLVLAAVIGVFGLKRAIGYMKLLFAIGGIGTAILVVAMLVSKTSTFNDHLRSQTGFTAARIEGEARSTGFEHGGFSFFHTLRLTNWYVTVWFFASLLLYIGGEIKNAAHTIRYALLAAVGFAGVATLAWAASLNSVVPSSLQGALAWNSFGGSRFTTAQVPYAHELTNVLWGTSGPGLVLTLIGFLAPMAWIMIWAPLVLSFTQRAILAWSLDGLTPRWVGQVNERWHTPIPALIVAFVMGESFMLVFAFAPSFRTVVLLVPLFIGIGITMLVGVFFPYTRRDLIEQSTIADARIFGVHKMTITCALGTAIMAFWTWLMLEDPIASGTDRTPLWVTAGIAVAIALYYVGLRVYRRRQGEDISVAFKRIPVE
ncbi:MAG TPA: hypothetical protein VFV85_01745 [Conexibacter sp.]|nr:hypothetical protein [Conexibacter sp.]